MYVTASVMYGQIVGFAFAFLSTLGVVVTCTWNQWSKTHAATSTSLLNSIWGFNGIWIQCLQYTAGQFQCDNYEVAIFELPIYMNTIRGFMCIAVILSVAGCLTALMGMQCSRLLDNVPSVKKTLILTTAGLFMAAGILTSASIIWFVVMVMQNYLSEANQDNSLRYTLGATIWVGVTSCLSCFTTSAIFFCLPGPTEDEDSYVPMRINAPRSLPRQSIIPLPTYYEPKETNRYI